MKKYIYSFIIFIIILGITPIQNAYSTSKYSIDIPSTYSKVSEGSFTKSNGDNINIQVTSFSGKDSNVYTETQLNYIIDNMKKEIENYRTTLAMNLKEKYGNSMTDSEIAQYALSFKCNYIDTKEITTCTKNNYKCYHIIANYTMGDDSYFTEQYGIVSNNNIFMITATAKHKSDFQSTEIKNAINSFTINDYKEPNTSKELSNNSVIHNAFIKIGSSFILLGSAAVIEYVVNKKRNKKIIFLII